MDAIARFAPDVLDACAAGDPVAADIADRAAQELVLLIAAGIAHVHGPHGNTTEDVPTALGGRLLAPGAPLRLRLDTPWTAPACPSSPAPRTGPRWTARC